MRNLTTTLTAMSLFVVLLPTTGSAPDRGPARIAGSINMTYTPRAGYSVGDTEGHAIGGAEARGTNRNTGPADYMRGAEVVSVETNDLVNGNGTHQGYITFTGSEGTTISRWTGKVTTTLSADKQPITTFEGTWTLIKGTGKHERATGRGTYKGHFTSQTQMVVDWQGELATKLANN